MTTATALVQSAADAPQQAVLGGSISIRLRGEHSAGSLALIEQRVPPGYPGPPLHLHPEFDELFHVLSGELCVRVDGETRTLGPGDIAWVPRGTPHTFANPGDAPAHALVTVTPAGHERYFDALVALLDGATGPPDFAAIAALNEAHGTVVL